MATQGLNEFKQIGFLAADPAFQNTSGGNKVVNFRVITNSTWLDANEEKQQRAEGFRHELWGDQAEIFATRMKKGDQVYVESELRNHVEPAQGSGEKKYSIRFIVQKWRDLERRSYANQDSAE